MEMHSQGAKRSQAELATEHEPFAPVAININVCAERECRHHTHKLGHRTSRKAKGSETVLCHICLESLVLWY